MAPSRSDDPAAENQKTGAKPGGGETSFGSGYAAMKST
jgi:hypothetical protein